MYKRILHIYAFKFRIYSEYDVYLIYVLLNYFQSMILQNDNEWKNSQIKCVKGNGNLRNLN